MARCIRAESADRIREGNYLMQSMRDNIEYIQRLVEEIMRVTAEKLNSAASSVLLVDPEKQELCFQFVHGPAEGLLKQASLGTESGIVGWVADHGVPLIVNDVHRDNRFCQDIDEITGFTTESILCAPLVAHGEVIGVIEVLNKLDGSDFNERDLQTLVSVASIAASAIEIELAEEAMQASEVHFSELLDNLSDRDLTLFDLDPYTQGDDSAERDGIHCYTNSQLRQRNG
jgi:GAF domain-containing protein